MENLYPIYPLARDYLESAFAKAEEVIELIANAESEGELNLTEARRSAKKTRASLSFVLRRDDEAIERHGHPYDVDED